MYCFKVNVSNVTLLEAAFDPKDSRKQSNRASASQSYSTDEATELVIRQGSFIIEVRIAIITTVKSTISRRSRKVYLLNVASRR